MKVGTGPAADLQELRARVTSSQRAWASGWAEGLRPVEVTDGVYVPPGQMLVARPPENP